MKQEVLVAEPRYQLIIISSHFGVILSVSLYFAVLIILLLSLGVFLDQIGKIASALGHGFCTLGWTGHKERGQKLFCNLAHGYCG